MRISDKKTEAMHAAPSEGQHAGGGCPLPVQHKSQQHKTTMEALLFTHMLTLAKDCTFSVTPHQRPVVIHSHLFQPLLTYHHTQP